MWLILWGLWAVFGCRWGKRRTGGGTRRRVATRRAEGRQRSRPLSNVGRLPLLLKRSEAAEQLRSRGTLPAVHLSFSPFKRSRLTTFFFLFFFFFFLLLFFFSLFFSLFFYIAFLFACLFAFRRFLFFCFFFLLAFLPPLRQRSGVSPVPPFPCCPCGVFP